MRFSRWALIRALAVAGVLPLVVEAGDGDNSRLGIKLEVACVEVALSDQIRFGIDALKANKAAQGIRGRSVQQLVKELSTTKGARVVFSGFTTVRNGGEASFGGGRRSLRVGEVERVSVQPTIQSNGKVTLSVAQISDKVTGYRHTRRGIRRYLKRRPIVAEQSMESSVTVRQGTAVVLGGLITKRDGHRFERLLLVQTHG